MKQFKHTTANWRNARSRPTMPAGNGSRSDGAFAASGNALQCGPGSAPGGAS